MYLEENINVVRYSLIFNYLKDLIYSLDVENNNSMLKRNIKTKNMNKRKIKIKKKRKEKRKRGKSLKSVLSREKD